jgi:hypothetical protein
MDRRREDRKALNLLVTVSGRDATGLPFCEDVLASSISLAGALLSGITRPMRSGDYLSVEYNRKKCHFRVVWVRESGDSTSLIQAAVHRYGSEGSPWADVI